MIVLAVSAIPFMDLKRAMAANVRRARHERELTQEELADLAWARCALFGLDSSA